MGRHTRAERRNSPLVVNRTEPVSSPGSRRRASAMFKKAPPKPLSSRPKNLLTTFARCTVGQCRNKKQPGTPRCRWHNRWMYKVPADSMCAMFEAKLASLTAPALPEASGGGGGGGGGAPALDPKEQLRADTARALEASQTALWTALRKEHSKYGVSFSWPSEDFVKQRRSELTEFLTAIARELVQPSGTLDISDSFAIDAVVERMHAVGLMDPTSQFKKLEAAHMKSLITFFKVFSLDNSRTIDGRGVLRFIDYMFQKKDRMVIDLLYAKQTHIKALLDMLNAPVEE